MGKNLTLPEEYVQIKQFNSLEVLKTTPHKEFWQPYVGHSYINDGTHLEWLVNKQTTSLWIYIYYIGLCHT